MLKDYGCFRKGILENYAKFLDGIWKEYQTFRGLERYSEPKPEEAPQAKPEEIPTETTINDVPAEAPQGSIVPEQPIPQRPEPPTAPKPPKPAQQYVNFKFYEANISLPKIEVPLLHKLNNTSFGDSWRALDNAKADKSLVPALRQASEAHGLNDWFTLELATRYANVLLGENNVNGATALVHYIMTQMDYDVRLARVGGESLLLIHFGQTVYARSYIVVDNCKYYLYEVTPIKKNIKEEPIYTCDMPADADMGRFVNLLITKPLVMPSKEKEFEVSHGNMVLRGKINEVVMEMLRHYPQMPVSCYAQSTIDRELRNSLASQIKQQLANKPQLEAVNTLLGFVQFGFDYATDSEQHGYEKPYFLEELFYYPRCDCEDRSVLYCTLLREGLGVDNVLVEYSNHECSAVALDAHIKGDALRIDGKLYYISDPTFIGAPTGMCMSEYRYEKPEVTKWY